MRDLRFTIVYTMFFFLTLILLACDAEESINEISGAQYQVAITRTQYGIPHITANDWGSLGYGHGYAYAQDNYCVMMRGIVVANGQSAEYFGAEAGNLNNDFVYKYLNNTTGSISAAQFFDSQPENLKQLLAGYIAGVNRYFRETGPANLPEGVDGCRNAEWVGEIKMEDYANYLHKIVLWGSSDHEQVRQLIIDTEPPTRNTLERGVGELPVEQVRQKLKAMAQALGTPKTGSNAIVLGSDYTQSGAGMLLGNPHQPWRGRQSFYQVHLTLPGEYDVMGTVLQGVPIVAIGYNRNLAWTHTVSFANRFTLYELQLNPDNPFQYRYDDEWRDITAQTVTAKIKLADGRIETRAHTFYRSHYGPIVDLRSQLDVLGGWPMISGTLLSLRDANIDNQRSLQQWVRMGQAQTMDAFIESLKLIGNPVFHTLAADRNGEMFYGDVSVVPHVTQAQLDTCIHGPLAPLLMDATAKTVVTLDGSTSSCEWGVDADSPNGSNIYGFNALPKYRSREYAGNSNNSYWLSNANKPITGLPSIMGAVGHEGDQQFLRTRITHQMIAERMTASDGLSNTPGFTLETLQGLMYSNRVFGAEIALDDMLAICDGIDSATATDAEKRAREACDVLGQWDRRVNPGSVGAHIFTEFWDALQDATNAVNMVINFNSLWAVDFDPAHPIETPRGFDQTVPSTRKIVIEALSDAVMRIEDAGLALNSPWREVQYVANGDERIPIHGGRDDMGVFGVITSILNQGGYNDIVHGNTYIQTVTWDETECPIADAILTHAQSSDPQSPHFLDQTRLYANKAWVRMPFCTRDIEAQKIDSINLSE